MSRVCKGVYVVHHNGGAGLSLKLCGLWVSFYSLIASMQAATEKSETSVGLSSSSSFMSLADRQNTEYCRKTLD